MRPIQDKTLTHLGRLRPAQLPPTPPEAPDTFQLGQRLSDLGQSVRTQARFLLSPTSPRFAAAMLPQPALAAVALQALDEFPRPRFAPGDFEAVSRFLDEATGTTVRENNKVMPLVDGPQSFNAMMGAIDHANTSVNWSLHIFDPDRSGWEVARHLAGAAERGCKVRLLLDEVGAGKALRSAEGHRLLDYLKENGVEVLTDKTAGHSCNHRKVLATDGSQVFMGGMNVGDWDLTYSHDVNCVVTGGAVPDLQRGFQTQWERAGGTLSAADLEVMYPPPQQHGHTGVRVLHHEGNRDRHIKLAYLTAIDTAAESICIANPYFTDRDVLNALKQAAARGVQVDLILPRHNDYKLMEHSQRALFDELVGAGIHVHEYDPTMSHHKVAVFDHRYATVGSSNLDRLSLEYNDEVNLWMDDPRFAARLERTLHQDMQQSVPVHDYHPHLGERLLNTASQWLVARL